VFADKDLRTTTKISLNNQPAMLIVCRSVCPARKILYIVALVCYNMCLTIDGTTPSVEERLLKGGPETQEEIYKQKPLTSNEEEPVDRD
jgi:hypothetical protein